MRTSSAKAKGRRAVAEVRELLLKYAPGLSAADVEVKATSVPGEDLWLSPAARAAYPFTFEVKNQERMNLYDALAQAKTHAEGTEYQPVLIFRRNRTQLFVALDFESFLKLRGQG